MYIDNLSNKGIQGLKGEKGDPGPKGDTGREGIDGLQGSPGSPGHVFMVPVSIEYKKYLSVLFITIFLKMGGNNGGGEKGPDAQAEAFRQMLSQHMVNSMILW